MNVPPSSIEFVIGRVSDDHDPAPTITPSINGVDLVALVSAFESAAGYEPAGGYGGLVPSWFDYGDLHRYFLGVCERQFPEPGVAWVLGCDCGDVGCWPLTATIALSPERVVWTGFAQEHRPGRDYSGFGPFTFDRADYESAVANAVRDLPAE